MVQASEGLVIGNVSILGLSQLYEIVMPDCNYYVVAELHSAGVLAIKASTREAADIYFLDYEGGAPRDMGKSFADAVVALLTRSGKT